MKGLLFFSTIYILIGLYANIKLDTPKQIHNRTFAQHKDTTAFYNKYLSDDSLQYYYSNLSIDFDINFTARKYTKKDTAKDSIFIEIINKKTKIKQIIKRESETWMTFYIYEDFDFVRSYSTELNADSTVVDNMFGNIVVADLNFDNLEDIAFVRGLSATSGAYYYFYVQNKNQYFEYDSILTKKSGFFPNEINTKTKQISNQYHCGACAYCEETFQYHQKTNNWEQLTHLLYDFCQDSVIIDTLEFE